MIELTGLMLVELTDAEILCLHKWMWSDMQKELGDNPGAKERIEFKSDWCEEHRVLIRHNCFLCEHAGEDRFYCAVCKNCLVVWPDGSCYSNQDGTIPEEYYANSYYLNAPISDILDLPTREFVSDRRTQIHMRECDVEELKRRMKESDI